MGEVDKPFSDREDEIDDSPIEEVRLTVPITDDSTIPCLTFRTWVIGLATCVILSFTNKFFGFRENPLSVTSTAAQIAVVPIGRLMAATLPTKYYKFPFTNWSFTLNPGPFNLKEHVLITIFANCGYGGAYADHIVIAVKAYYHQGLRFIVAFFLVLTTQLLGYGWAGLFRKYLVDSSYMWWPQNLVQVSLFRALHEKEKRRKGGITRQQFFVITIVTSFAYYIVPGYLFPTISCLSVLCWIFKKNLTMQQVGSGLHGYGIGAFSFDWSTVVSFLGTPLATPPAAIINTLIGYVFLVYIVLPITYYGNFFEARRFPLMSSKTFDFSGQTYNISRIMDQKTFTFNNLAYASYSKLYMSVLFAFDYGMSFAAVTATVSHVALFHGKSILELWSKARAKIKDNYADVHLRTMRKNYKQVPQWWFYVLLVVTFALSLLACEGFGGQIQLPWWGLIMACAIAFLFTLPIGIITATTNITPGLNVITELIIGYIYPGRPLANVSFKTYGYISMNQALFLIQDLKLGHYMKVPPKSMFLVQLVGTIVSSQVYLGTTWWLLSDVKNICDLKNLPEGSPWTCPNDAVFFNASIIWGVVGPLKMFGPNSIYSGLNWFFLVGLLAPVPAWLLSRKFPEKKWLKHINMPVLFVAATGIPPARSINYTTWGLVGLFFNCYVYSRYKGWWARYNYVLSAGLDTGIAFVGLLLYVLQGHNIYGPSWWGGTQDDYCPLATCPTSPGIQVDGCPVISSFR